MKKKLTILTRPTNVPLKVNKKYGGHIAVTRSLIEGLEKIGYEDFNYGPSDERDIGEYVHVLAGVNTLQYAIKLKKERIIKQLTAGSNIVVFPIEHSKIIADENIDLFLTPSQWVTNMYIEMEPKMKGRCCSWPVGVDTNLFDPGENLEVRKKVLVYHKEGSEQFCDRICYILKKYKFDPIVLKYGDYVLEDFVKILAKSIFSVVISSSESQGIFLAEAWAMNVPTICYDPHYYKWNYNGIIYERAGDVSTCSYLTKETGLCWDGIKELESILSCFDKAILGDPSKKMGNGKYVG